MSLVETTVNTASVGGDSFIVTLSGEADLHSSPSLERAFEGVIGLGGTSVALNLAGVGFVDSTALGVLLRYHGRLQARGGHLVVVTDDHRVLRTFEITGLDHILAVERRLSDAVARIRRA